MLNAERKQLTEEAAERADIALQEGGALQDRVLVLYDAEIHESIAGIVAGRIKDKYYRPTILITDLTYIGLGNWKQARKALNYEIIDDKKIFTFSTYRIIRLVSLIIFYELHETEYLHTKIRLMKRQVLKVRKMYRIELLLLDFLSNDKWQLASSDKRRKMQEKLKSELEDIRNDVFESQLLRYFDFTAWIESKIDKTPLAKILSARYAPRSAGEGAQHSKRAYSAFTSS